ICKRCGNIESQRRVVGDLMQRRQTSRPRFVEVTVALARHAVAPINGMKLRRGSKWKVTLHLRGTSARVGVQIGRTNADISPSDGQPLPIQTPAYAGAWGHGAGEATHYFRLLGTRLLALRAPAGRTRSRVPPSAALC